MRSSCELSSTHPTPCRPCQRPCPTQKKVADGRQICSLSPLPLNVVDFVSRLVGIHAIYLNSGSNLAASSSAWQLSSVGVVHNIADIWRKIKRRNLSDSFIIQKPQSRSFCQCMPRNFEETFSGFVMSPNSSHKCPKKSDSPFFECRFADQEVCDFAHPCRL